MKATLCTVSRDDDEGGSSNPLMSKRLCGTGQKALVDDQPATVPALMTVH